MKEDIKWEVPSNPMVGIEEIMGSIRKDSYRVNPKPFHYKGGQYSCNELVEIFKRDNLVTG